MFFFLDEIERADALLLTSFRCLVTVNVLWLFIMVPWVVPQCVIVFFPDHTHLLLYALNESILIMK